MLIRIQESGAGVSSYRIVVKGHLSGSFAVAVDPAMTHIEDGDNTALTGRFVDQSQLIGMINHLHGLGMQIVSCEVIDDEQRP